MECKFPGNNFFGPQLLLSDDILNWIVHLAHYKKLLDIQALHDQTDWQHTEKYSSAIIEMVKSCAPPPPPPALLPSASLFSSSGCLKLFSADLSAYIKLSAQEISTLHNMWGRRSHWYVLVQPILLVINTYILVLASNRLCPQWKSKTISQMNKNTAPTTSIPLPLSEDVNMPSMLGKHVCRCRGCGAAGQVGSFFYHIHPRICLKLICSLSIQ